MEGIAWFSLMLSVVFVFAPNGVNSDCDEYRLIVDGFFRQHMLRKLTKSPEKCWLEDARLFF